MTGRTGVGDAVRAEAAARWAGRAKPPGSLGALEDLGIRLAGIAGRCPPPIPSRPAVALFAGDHDVVADGASAWPSEVTAAMVATIASGGAAINAIATTIGATVTVIDVGVAHAIPMAETLAPGVEFRSATVRAGVGNIAREPAMTLDQAQSALDVGRAVAEDLVAHGADCLIGGEMGIGNTTPSAALISACTGRLPAELIGPGAGAPDRGLGHKRDLVWAALDRAGSPDQPIGLLAELGGLEIAALVGFQISAAQQRVPYLVDGVIALAALCVAERLSPGTATGAIAGHRSTEPAATVALDHLGLRPLLELDLRLGEGTGAALAFPLVASAARALGEMADLPAG